MFKKQVTERKAPRPEGLSKGRCEATEEGMGAGHGLGAFCETDAADGERDERSDQKQLARQTAYSCASNHQEVSNEGHGVANVAKATVCAGGGKTLLEPWRSAGAAVLVFSHGNHHFRGMALLFLGRGHHSALRHLCLLRNHELGARSPLGTAGGQGESSHSALHEGTLISRGLLLLCLAGGLVQLGPDGLPVVWAQITASDGPCGSTFNGRRENRRCRSESRCHIAQMTHSRTASCREVCFLGGVKRSEMFFEVHATITSNDVLRVNIV